MKNNSTAKEGKQEVCDKQQNTRTLKRRVKMPVMQFDGVHQEMQLE